MSRFENFTPPTLGSELSTSEITMVEELTALANSGTGEFIRKSAGSLVNATLSETVALSGLSDVAITSEAQGDILYFNGSSWVNLAAGLNGFLLKTQGAGANPIWDSAGSGSVTTVSVVTANGVSGSVATAATTPAITFTLGAITPSSIVVDDITINGNTISSAGASSLAITPTAGQAILLDGTISIDAGVVTGVTSIDVGGTTLLATRALTIDTGGVFNIVLASAAGDDFTVDTDKLVVEGDTGNVGIGTATPTRKLDVISSAAGMSSVMGVHNLNGADGDKARLTFNAGNSVTSLSTGYAGVQGFRTTGADTGNLEFITTDSAGTGQIRMGIYVGNVGIGTASPDRLLHAEASTALTNAVQQVFRLTHITSGTPANSIGVGLEFEQETTVNNNEIIAVIEAVVTDVTSTSEDADLVFRTMAAGAVAAERMRLQSDGALDLPTGGDFQINGTSVLNATTLGSGVLTSSLTSVGTLSSGAVPASLVTAGSFGAGAYVISTSLQAATIELGHATDTTFARVSAGVVSIEGNNIITANIVASLTVAGVVELATTAEINTGTDTTRAMSVDQYVASNRNVRYILYRVVANGTDTAVATTVGGDLELPFTGTITEIGAYVDTVGTTGTMTVDVNLGGTTLMTTNKITIDTDEKSSRTAVTAPALTTTAVTAGDLITVDIDAIHSGTAAKGLTIRLGIRQT